MARGGVATAGHAKAIGILAELDLVVDLTSPGLRPALCVFWTYAARRPTLPRRWRITLGSTVGLIARSGRYAVVSGADTSNLPSGKSPRSRARASCISTHPADCSKKWSSSEVRGQRSTYSSFSRPGSFIRTPSWMVWAWLPSPGHDVTRASHGQLLQREVLGLPAPSEGVHEREGTWAGDQAQAGFLRRREKPPRVSSGERRNTSSAPSRSKSRTSVAGRAVSGSSRSASSRAE